MMSLRLTRILNHIIVIISIFALTKVHRSDAFRNKLEDCSHHRSCQNNLQLRPKLSQIDPTQHILSRRDTNYGSREKTQVAISVEAVPVKEAPKKKRFPISWIRDQYPFNAYSRRHQKRPGKTHQDQLLGQYSTNREQVEMLDPYPSSWVRIPDKPTAIFKLEPQYGSSMDLRPNVLPPPSLQYHEGPGIALAPPNRMPHSQSIEHGSLDSQRSLGVKQIEDQSQHMMTSESNAEYSHQQVEQGQQEQSSGFGGIQLSFGNGRSISFGGGQGLTIGGRGGAISIGGKGESGDNAASASGYAPTSAHQGQQASKGYENDDYSKKYVSKYPSSSMEFPRQGKKIIHANLDMAPVKFRLHSSPRVKITTGSRDPLEKPSEEELNEKEEDIFEPPAPFPKPNTTDSSINTSNMTSGNETSTLSPIQISDFANNLNPYGQTKILIPGDDYQYQLVQQQVIYDGGIYNPSNRSFDYQPTQMKFLDRPYLQANPVPMRQANYAPPHSTSNVIPDQRQGPIYQIVGQQQSSYDLNRPQPMLDPNQIRNNQFDQPLPENEGQGLTQALKQTDIRPAVNQWRQFSPQARDQLNRSVPRHFDAKVDDNARYYNAGSSVVSNSLVEQPSRPIDQNSLPPSGLRIDDNRRHLQITGNDLMDVAASKTNHMLKPNPDSSQLPVVGLPAIATPRDYSQYSNHGRSFQPQFNPPKLQSNPTKLLTPPDIKKFMPEPQASEYHSSAYSSHSSNRHQQASGYQAPSRIFSFGSDGFSAGYESPSKSYPPQPSGYGQVRESSSYGSNYNHPRVVPSDGFDQKNYQAKIEKYDPDAHDPREKSKIILFTRPRISIHSANSSTTTPRPKNPQRLINIVSRPIFLNRANSTNSTNATHHEEEFIDPDLKEPMDVLYSHNYGYGVNYANRYNSQETTTTKKPKKKTTTTEAPSTTTSLDSSEVTTTAPETTTKESQTSSTSEASVEGSSSSTESSSSATTVSPSPTDAPSTVDSSSTSMSPSTESSSSRTEEEDEVSPDPGPPSSTEAEVEVETTSPSPDTSATTSSLSDSPATAEPEFSALLKSNLTSNKTNDKADSESSLAVTQATIITSTQETTTRSPKKSRTPRPNTNLSDDSTASTTLTTTTSAPVTDPTTITVEVKMAPSDEQQPAINSSSRSMIDGFNDTSETEASTTTEAVILSATDQPPTDTDTTESDDTVKESSRENSTSQDGRKSLNSRENLKSMNLTPVLIDKLMASESVVKLMSKQVDRVMNLGDGNTDRKRLIVKQVFDNMMQRSEELSSSNIQKAVKMVASSYENSVETRRGPKYKRSQGGSWNDSRSHKIDSKGFGFRSMTSN